MNPLAKSILVCGLFLLSVVLGFLLSRRGRSLNPVLSAVHKLVSLGSIVYLAVFIVSDIHSSVRYPIPLLALLSVFIIALVATGAVLSGKNENRPLRRVHDASTVLMVLCLALTLLARAVPA